METYMMYQYDEYIYYTYENDKVRIVYHVSL